MKYINIFLLVLVSLLLINPVLAAEGNISASRSVTANGPYDLLVPLGIEKVLPLDIALMFYNWIAVMLLFFLIAMASQRNMRFFNIIAPLLAGIFAYFGWLNDANDLKVWSIIGLTALLSVGIYMKDTNKEKWGSGGPGLTLLNFVFFMILLQAAVGVVNSTNIWEHNLAVTPEKYQNVDLETEMSSLSNTGGLMSGAISTALALLELGIMILQLILSIILTIAAFSITLYLVFPFLYDNLLVVALIGAVQVVVWLLYAWFMFVIIYKPMPDGGWI